MRVLIEWHLRIEKSSEVIWSKIWSVWNDKKIIKMNLCQYLRIYIYGFSVILNFNILLIDLMMFICGFL